MYAKQLAMSTAHGSCISANQTPRIYPIREGYIDGKKPLESLKEQELEEQKLAGDFMSFYIEDKSCRPIRPLS